MRINSDEYKPPKIESEDFKKFVIIGDRVNHMGNGEPILSPVYYLRFAAYDTTTKRTEVIYDVSYNKSGYPMFLIYNDGQWIRKSAKYFKLRKEED